MNMGPGEIRGKCNVCKITIFINFRDALSYKALLEQQTSAVTILFIFSKNIVAF